MKWDIPHSETVFGKRTPDDGHIWPKHVGKVGRGRKISYTVDGGIVCEEYINATGCLNIIFDHEDGGLSSFEASTNFYQTRRRHVPENSIFLCQTGYASGSCG
jgi:hypothetical protein